MTPNSLQNPDVILPGDVVQDRATHKPLQVIDTEPRQAGRVTVVWESEINHEEYDIQPDEQVFNCVYLPKGERVHTPRDVHPFPQSRLRRVPSEQPSASDRPQAVVVRSFLAEVVADLRDRGAESVADAVAAEVGAIEDSDYALSVTELADVIAAERDSDE